MLGLLYLCLCFGVGFVICTLAFPKLGQMTKTTYTGKEIGVSPLFVLFPAWFVTGTVPMIWATYGFAYLFRNKPAFHAEAVDGVLKAAPLYWANLIVLPVAIMFVLLGIGVILSKKRRSLVNPIAGLKLREIVYIIAAFSLVFLLMWWTFFVREGRVYVGVSVFGDFAPHLGMIRSFSYGTNFPTAYSHFAGEDIKYHFLFQFLVGNLEYLGLRIDFAFNLPSCISMFGVFLLLYAFAVKLSGKRTVGCLAGLFFAFRSGDALMEFLATVDTKTTTYMEALQQNMTFIGDTPNENWGLWNLNVYCNQRHLAIGMCVLLFILYMMTECVFKAARRVSAAIADAQEALENAAQEKLENEVQEALEQAAQQEGESAPENTIMTVSENPATAVPERLLWSERVLIALKSSLMTSSGWAPRSVAIPIVLGILLGLSSFLNGACVIGCLAVLFVLALVSDHRLEFAMIAIITVCFSVLESRFFIDGSAVSPSYYFGFIATNKNLFGVASYVLTLLGVLPILLLAATVIINGTHKWILFAFTAPFILAFTLSLTTDVTVNHKYIMLSVMLVGIYAAMFVHWLFKRFGAWPKMVAIFLLVCMTATGFYDFTCVLKKNDSSHSGCITFDMEDPVTLWFKDHATSQDIVLSSYYSLHKIVMGGAMLYYGWPYFAWSAGYDTNFRDAETKAMFAANTPTELKTMIEANNIRFIYVDNELRSSDYFELHEETIRHTYQVAFENGSEIVYDTTLPVTEEDPMYDPYFDYNAYMEAMYEEEESYDDEDVYDDAYYEDIGDEG